MISTVNRIELHDGRSALHHKIAEWVDRRAPSATSSGNGSVRLLDDGWTFQPHAGRQLVALIDRNRAAISPS